MLQVSEWFTQLLWPLSNSFESGLEQTIRDQVIQPGIHTILLPGSRDMGTVDDGLSEKDAKIALTPEVI